MTPRAVPLHERMADAKGIGAGPRKKKPDGMLAIQSG
jgi:hypothetical protein